MKKVSALFVSVVCGHIEKVFILRDSLWAQTDLPGKVLKFHDSEEAPSDRLKKTLIFSDAQTDLLDVSIHFVHIYSLMGSRDCKQRENFLGTNSMLPS